MANCVAEGARHVERKQATTTYWVDLGYGNVTCDFAKPWVAKLTHARPAKYDADGKLAGGPSGWICHSGRPYPALAYRGGCSTKNQSVFFSWKPRYHDDNPGRRVYTYDLKMVGSGTVNPYSGGSQTSHWTIDVPALRLSVIRRTSWLPAKFRNAGWELFFLYGKPTTGTGTTTIDYVNPPEGCPAHASAQFEVSASVGNDGVGESSISAYAADSVPGCTMGALDATGGGPVNTAGLCTGFCWEFVSTGGTLRFPNNHKRPRPFPPPMKQIVSGQTWSKTVEFQKSDAGGVSSATVRVSLTPQKG